MDFSIASYSFHRLLQAGRQDMFKYVTDSRDLGASQLDPWNWHLAPIKGEDDTYKATEKAFERHFSETTKRYIEQVKAATEAVGLAFGCVAVDGAHIYEPDLEKRKINRASAYRWLDVAARLNARQVRLDSGGPESMPDDVFEIIVDGYVDLINRANDLGLEILIENHWGPSIVPENLIKLLTEIDGLGLLFDSANWVDGRQDDGWTMCASYASAVHIQTSEFDDSGNDPTVDVVRVVRLLQAAGYEGVWGIESIPLDGDEYGAVKKTVALLKLALDE